MSYYYGEYIPQLSLLLVKMIMEVHEQANLALHNVIISKPYITIERWKLIKQPTRQASRTMIPLLLRGLSSHDTI